MTGFELIGTSALPYPVVIAGIAVLLMLVGIVDVLGKHASTTRFLPHWAWFLVVIALPVLGLLLWIILGRPRTKRPPRRRRRRQAQSERVITAFPEYDRKGRFVPDDAAADAAFLAQCRERAEKQRLEAEVERFRREMRDY